MKDTQVILEIIKELRADKNTATSYEEIVR